jgi:hypothetical protein
MNPLIILLCLASISLLERLSGRPVLATLVGLLLARLLGGKPAMPLVGGLYAVYHVRMIPRLFGNMTGQAWGQVILIQEGMHTLPLELHERAHVQQYRCLTSLGFWCAYVGTWLWNLIRYRDALKAYWEIPLEIEARRAEGRKA